MRPPAAGFKDVLHRPGRAWTRTDANALPSAPRRGFAPPPGRRGPDEKGTESQRSGCPRNCRSRTAPPIGHPLDPHRVREGRRSAGPDAGASPAGATGTAVRVTSQETCPSPKVLAGRGVSARLVALDAAPPGGSAPARPAAPPPSSGTTTTGGEPHSVSRSGPLPRGTVAVRGVALSALVAAPLGAPVAQDGTGDDPARLDPLEIRDERRVGDVVHEDHAGGHARIEGEALERRDATLGEVLAREAGVQSRTSGGFGSFSTVTVRAASPAQTTVHLDGVRLNGAGDPVVDLSTLELLSLDAIDLYRGAVPLQLGPGSIGGAVDLRTPRVEGSGPATRALLGVASFGTHRQEIAHRGRHGRWDVVGTLASLRSDNDFGFVDDNGTPLNVDDDRRERRNNADVARLGALLKVGTDHGEAVRTDLLLQLGSRELGVPEFRNARDNRARFDTDTLQLQLSHRRDGDGPWRSAHTGFVHAADNAYDDELGQVGLGRQSTRTDARALGFDGFWERDLGPGLAEGRYELRHERLDANDRLDADNEVDARRDELSLSAQWSWYPGDGRFVVVPGLRFAAVEDRVERRTALGADAGGDRAGRALSPRLGARADLSERLSLHASVGRFHREPSFSELFVDRGLVRGNPDLEAERGTNAEVGARWSPASELAFGAALFASRRRELIATVYDARGVGRAVNVGRARVEGVELSASWEPAPAWRLSANATFQDARTVSDVSRLDGRQVPGEAREAIHARVRFSPHRRWNLWVEADGRDRRFYDTANVLPADDGWLANAGLDWTGRRLKAAFAVHNLGDRNVEDYNGFPRPGRAFSLNLSIDLGSPSP